MLVVVALIAGYAVARARRRVARFSTPFDCAADETFMRSLREKGYAVREHAIPRELVLACAEEARGLSPVMKHGQIQNGLQSDQGARKARGDKMVTLNPRVACNTRYLPYLMDKFDLLRTEMNGAVLEAKDTHADCTTFMLAVYPGDGTGYVRHKDSDDAHTGRKLTAIVYLNEGWKATDGGSFRIWPGDCGDSDPCEEVAPDGGKLVVFYSNLWHEVLPVVNGSARIACTAWFSNRADLAAEIIAEERAAKLDQALKKIALKKLRRTMNSGK
jgi:SM-20-related protein